VIINNVEEYSLLACNSARSSETAKCFRGMYHHHLQGSRESQARNQQKQVASSVNHTWKIQPDICQYLCETNCKKASGTVAVVCMETKSVNEAKERVFRLGPEKDQLHTELS
jgi:hypothetical protein